MTAAMAMIVAAALNKLFGAEVLLVTGSCSFDDMGSGRWRRRKELILPTFTYSTLLARAPRAKSDHCHA